MSIDNYYTFCDYFTKGGGKPIVATWDGDNGAVTFASLANPAASTLTLTGGTGLTTSQPVLNMSQTWNNGAVAFTGALLKITNTASLAASPVLDIGDGAGNSQATFYVDGSSEFNYQSVAINTGGNLIQSSASYIGWPSTAFAVRTSTPDLSLFRDGAAGVLAQRNGTNAQTFRIYNTFTNTSNFEFGYLDWQGTSNVFTIGLDRAGSGINRRMAFISSFAESGSSKSFTFNAFGAGANRVAVNAAGAATNVGFEIQEGGVDKWEMASFPGGGTNRSFTFFNNTLFAEGLFIYGDTNIVSFGAGGLFGSPVNLGGLISSNTLISVRKLDNSVFADLEAADLYSNNTNFLIRTNTTLTGGGTGNVPTLTSGPVTGNPTKWLPIDDNGTTRFVPAW